MPVWVDLSEHQVSLNVYNSPDGKRLLLRPLAPRISIPPEISQIGFEPRGEAYERRDLRFSLQEIQRIFPHAKSREFPMSEIFYIQPREELVNLKQGMDTVVDLAAELGGTLSPWENSDSQTLGQWCYSNLTIESTQIRIAVSEGGVVQINRDPFTKEGRELLVTRDRILASIKDALPPVIDEPEPNWLERIIALPDDQLLELARIVGTPKYEHGHWRSFTEIDIHALDNVKIRRGFEQLAQRLQENTESVSAVAARAPWHVTKEVFLAESRFEAADDGCRIIFDENAYVTPEKSAGKAKAEVHERLVTGALYGRVAGHFAPSLPPFEVMLDYPTAVYRLNQRAEKNVSRLLSQLGVGAKLLVGDDAYLKLHNPPYMDLVIERHAASGGDRLYLTHYYRSNGDSCLDCEMVFGIRSNGTLRLLETATQNPFRGGELRGLDVSFANMFSKNLLDQKFGDARVTWPREERESLDPRYFNEAGELYEARLEEYMRKVLLKGEEFSTLIFAVDEEEDTIAGEKFISGSNKGSITKAQNALLAKHGNFYVLGHSTMFKYMLANGIKTTFQLPIQSPEWLIEGQAYDVAIQQMNGSIENPARFWNGAIFKRMEKSFAGNGNGSEFVAMFVHDRSNTITSVPFDELETWHTQGLIKVPSPAVESAPAKVNEKFDPTTPEGYAKVMADPVLQDAYQDNLDALFQIRLVDVRNALRERGWEGAGHTLICKLDGSVHGVVHEITHIGAGKNVVAITWSVDGGTTRIQDDLTMSADELAVQINTVVGPIVEVDKKTNNLREFKVYIEGFQDFLPIDKRKMELITLDVDVMMSKVRPFTSSENRSTDIPPFNLPSDVTLEIEHSTLRLSASGYSCEIQATEPAPNFDDENKPWIRSKYEKDAPRSFVSALYNATKWLDSNLAWEAKKKSYSDGGLQLGNLAEQYAAFLHEKMPSHHDGRVVEMHRSFAIAIMDKDVDYLLGWIARSRGSNDNSKKFFSQATGCKLPSTIRDITAAIYAWAGFSPEQAIQIQTEKEAAREARLQARRIDDDIKWHGDSLSRTNVNHGGEIKTMKQFLDEILDKGYTHIGKRPVGAVTRYTLENPEIQRSFNIKGKMVDYVKAVLAKRELQKLELELPEDDLRPSLRP